MSSQCQTIFFVCAHSQNNGWSLYLTN